MKRLNSKLLILSGSLLSMVVFYSCAKDFLNQPPIGSISGPTLANATGVRGLLVGAYSLLDGNGAGVDDGNASVWNAWLGSAGGDDCHKGGGYGSQGERAEIESKKYNATNSILNDRWRVYYAGVVRANEAIRGLDALPAGAVTDAEALQIRAEARFLRGVYHLEAAKTWRNVPYVDETITFTADNYRVKNDVSIWPFIEADFQYALTNLTATKAEKGRAHKWAAMGFLIKTYMFQKKWAEAKPLLADLINNGTTADGTALGLLPEFSQNFRPAFENGKESLFAVQNSVNDGGQGRNGNTGESFNYPGWFAIGGWGNQPSFSLANSYKTTLGLPLLDTWNDSDVKSDFGMVQTAPFTPYTGELDPRIDWTLARRKIPFHDWGIKDNSVNQSGGPYDQKKTVHWKSETGGKGSEVVDGWQQATGINFQMIRFADVLLWAAEVEVEIGSLTAAEDFVNQVRNRAANPAGFLKEYLDNANPALGFSTTPAANYVVNPYPTGAFTLGGQAFARKAVRFERKMELAIEGHRFFDLQRYDLQEPGYMAATLNAYMAHERATWITLSGLPYENMVGATFVQGKHEIYAIPQSQIDQSVDAVGPTLTQNPGHN